MHGITHTTDTMAVMCRQCQAAVVVRQAAAAISMIDPNGKKTILIFCLNLKCYYFESTILPQTRAASSSFTASK
jgi:hypothetical protein